VGCPHFTDAPQYSPLETSGYPPFPVRGNIISQCRCLRPLRACLPTLPRLVFSEHQTRQLSLSAGMNPLRFSCQKRLPPSRTLVFIYDFHSMNFSFPMGSQPFNQISHRFVLACPSGFFTFSSPPPFFPHCCLRIRSPFSAPPCANS